MPLSSSYDLVLSPFPSTMFFAKNLFRWMSTSCSRTPWRSGFVHIFHDSCSHHLYRQAVRPKLEVAKTLEQAAITVDEMFSLAFQNSGKGDPDDASISYKYTLAAAEDSGGDSDEETQRREEEDREDGEEGDDGNDSGEPNSPVSIPLFSNVSSC